MKHGVVRNGRITTHYGDSALDSLARMSLRDVDTVVEAETKILAATGKMQMALLDAATAMKLEFGQEFFKKVGDAQAENEATAAELKIREAKAAMSLTPTLRAAKVLSIPCCFCKQSITTGQVYRKRRSDRAHESCL